MNKKKFLAMLLTCAMALAVLAGCSNSDTTAPGRQRRGRRGL